MKGKARVRKEMPRNEGSEEPGKKGCLILREEVDY